MSCYDYGNIKRIRKKFNWRISLRRIRS